MTEPMREKIVSFEDFLIDKHAEQYTGLDDEMPDNYSEWVADLETHYVIGYAQLWGSSLIQAKESEVEKLAETLRIEQQYSSLQFDELASLRTYVKELGGALKLYSVQTTNYKWAQEALLLIPEELRKEMEK